MAGFGLSTLLVVVILGGLAFVVAWKRAFLVLAALVVLIPFRDISIRWMNASTNLSADWVNALSRWWFVLVLALLAVLVIRWIETLIRDQSLPELHLLDYLLIAIIILAVVHALLSPNLRAGFTSLRGYLQPLMIFVLARVFMPTRKEAQLLLVLLLIVGMFMVSFEFWQVFTWSEADYRAAGYLDQTGRLVTPIIPVRGEEYIRPTSTVSGPNELGVDMLLLALGATFAMFSMRTSFRFVLGLASLLFILGVALTFSRSALLGLGVTILGVAALQLRGGSNFPSHSNQKYSFRLLALIIVVIVLLGAILFTSGALKILLDTILSFSQQYHFQDSLQAAQYLARNPGGVGMGLVEPKGALVLMNTEARYHVEGSLFQIAMEMGVWGLALWLAFWGACLVRIWRNWKDLNTAQWRIVSGTAFSGWIGALVAFVFLPLMQSISLMVWLWFLLGIAVEISESQG